MDCLILNTKSRRDVAELIKHIKAITIMAYNNKNVTLKSLQQGLTDHIYDKKIDNITLDLFDKTVQGKIKNNDTKVANNYLATELIDLTIYELNLYDGKKAYQEIIKFSNDENCSYSFIKDYEKGHNYLFLAKNKKKINKPITTGKQLFDAARKIENESGMPVTEWLIKHHYNLLTRWHLPVGPEDWFGSVPIPE